MPCKPKRSSITAPRANQFTLPAWIIPSKGASRKLPGVFKIPQQSSPKVTTAYYYPNHTKIYVGGEPLAGIWGTESDKLCRLWRKL